MHWESPCADSEDYAPFCRRRGKLSPEERCKGGHPLHEGAEKVANPALFPSIIRFAVVCANAAAHAPLWCMHAPKVMSFGTRPLLCKPPHGLPSFLLQPMWHARTTVYCSAPKSSPGLVPQTCSQTCADQHTCEHMFRSIHHTGRHAENAGGSGHQQAAQRTVRFVRLGAVEGSGALLQLLHSVHLILGCNHLVHRHDLC